MYPIHIGAKIIYPALPDDRPIFLKIVPLFDCTPNTAHQRWHAASCEKFTVARCRIEMLQRKPAELLIANQWLSQVLAPFATTHGCSGQMTFPLGVMFPLPSIQAIVQVILLSLWCVNWMTSVCAPEGATVRFWEGT